MQDETIGVCGIKLIFPPDSKSPIRPAGKVQHVGMALNIRGEPIHPLVGWSADHPKANVSRDVLFVTGACLCIRRAIFNKVGGFGMEYGMGTFEDTDLCFKVLFQQKRVYVNVEALGYHYVGSTVEKKKMGFPMGQNKMMFQTKWGNTGMMQWSDWLFL
jgi:GT2 family glycosyltransferase